MSRQVSGHAQSQRTLSESVRSLSAATASDVEAGVAVVDGGGLVIVGEWAPVWDVFVRIAICVTSQATTRWVSRSTRLWMASIPHANTTWPKPHKTITHARPTPGVFIGETP